MLGGTVTLRPGGTCDSGAKVVTSKKKTLCQPFYNSQVTKILQNLRAPLPPWFSILCIYDCLLWTEYTGTVSQSDKQEEKWKTLSFRDYIRSLVLSQTQIEFWKSNSLTDKHKTLE
jgi:hypothetical protein